MDESRDCYRECGRIRIIGHLCLEFGRHLYPSRLPPPMPPAETRTDLASRLFSKDLLPGNPAIFVYEVNPTLQYFKAINR